MTIIHPEGSDMTDKTENLMARLTSTDTPEELEKYLEEIDKYPKNFKDYIQAILNEKNMSIADLQRECRISNSRTYIYQIMDGSKKPGRDKIIAIAIACKMTLPECQRALEIAQAGILYAKSRRDSLIIYAITNKKSIRELNDLFEKNGCALLE